MESLWKSFSQPAGTHTSSSESGRAQSFSSLKALLTILACSHLKDMSINERLYPDIGTRLGRGATFLVERREAKGRKMVAVKHLIQDNESSHGVRSYSASTRSRIDNVLLEVQALLHLPLLRHPNIINLLAFGWEDLTIPYLVVEYAELGSLDRFLRHRTMSWKEKLQMAIDVASGLEVIHRCGLIHGDVKLENLLVFPNSETQFIVKLSDFGLSWSGLLGHREYRGTHIFNAPEIRHSNHHTVHFTDRDYMRCDVYSYGLAIWEIIIDGKRYYSGNSIRIESQDMEKANYFLLNLDSTGEELVPYAEGCLQGLDSWTSSAEVISSIFSVTISRDPESRADITNIRLRLENDKKRGPDDVTPVRAPRYSTFDMGTAPLPWAVRTGLTTKFLAGAENDEDPFSGQDAFNLAACYAFGFGVKLGQDLSFKYLRLASERKYTPARVLYKIFEGAGLVEAQPSSTCRDAFDNMLGDMEDNLRLISLPAQFSSRIRSYYKLYRYVATSRRILYEGTTFSGHGQESSDEFVLGTNISILQKFTIELELAGGERLTRPLVHHLIATNECLAEKLLRNGVDGSVLIDDNVSLLNIACACGSKRIVHTLLELHPMMARQPTKDGVTPLHWLFMFEDTETEGIAKCLVEHDASFEVVGVAEFVDLNMVFSGAPMHWAIMARNTSAIRALVKVGADVNLTYSDQLPCLQYPVNAVDVAVCLLLPEVVELLIHLGADIGPRPGSLGIPSLHHIGDTIDPFRMLAYHGRFVEEAVRGTIDVLLAHGADINGVSEAGATALQWIVARTTCLTEVMASFLQYNPVFSVEDSPSANPIYLASVALQHDPVNSTKMEILLQYSLQRTKPENFVASCTGALRRCASNGSTGAAKEIIFAVLPYNKSVIDDEELLHLAAEYDHVGMIELLLELGATIDLDTGGTPAAAAASRGKRRALATLLSHGASVLSMPSIDSQVSLLHEIVSNTLSPHVSFQTLSFVCKNFKELLVPVVDNYDDRGLTALHQAIVWGNLKNVAVLLETLGASPLCVRDTEISLTTFATLARDHPPWFFAQQGDEVIKRHSRSVSDILVYFFESWNLTQPSTNVLAPHVTKYWTTPNDSLWSAADQLSDWLVTIH